MNLERPILTVLDMLQDDQMLSAAAVTGLLPGGITATLSDTERALRHLETKRQVVGISTDDGTLWKITANGKARLA